MEKKKVFKINQNEPKYLFSYDSNTDRHLDLKKYTAGQPRPHPAPSQQAPTQTKHPRSQGIHVTECTKYALQKMAFMGLKICALALLLLLGAAAEDERKPNIIFMLMDDVS